MGNAASDVTSGVKKQAEADSASQKCYQLVDLKGSNYTIREGHITFRIVQHTHTAYPFVT